MAERIYEKRPFHGKSQPRKLQSKTARPQQVVNTSGQASAQILHLPLGDDSSPSVDNAVGR
jgi:hypothetical protein